MTVPAAWMPRATMKRIIVHWTAGSHQANATDRKHYHILIDGDGDLVRGTRPINANAKGGPAPPASHTRNCNTESIGVSLCCMRGAVEQPFNAGPSPMTREQWDKLVLVCADLCRAYRITPAPETLLSHAEVQATLGIAQRQKWDYTRLAFDPSIKGAKAIGDRLRREVKAALGPVTLLDASRKPVAEFDGDSLTVDRVRVEPAEPFTDPHRVSMTQTMLRNLGYAEVGPADGKIGSFTRAAVLAYRAEKGLPATDVIDEQLMSALATDTQPRKMAPERANATPATVRARIPEARQSFFAKIGAKVTAIVTAAWVVVDGIMSRFGDAKPYIDPVREYLGDVPGWGWAFVGMIIAGGIWLFAKKAEDASGEAFQAGARR
jgi:hypothetical protein